MYTDNIILYLIQTQLFLPPYCIFLCVHKTISVIPTIIAFLDTIAIYHSPTATTEITFLLLAIAKVSSL